MKILPIIVSNVLLLTCFVSAQNDCEPVNANACFSGVRTELNKVIDSNGKDTHFTTNIFLENLCFAIDDALNCTSDVIDVDCSVGEGRSRFDKWNMAFTHTYYELCDNRSPNLTDDKIFIRALVSHLNCWNATHFFDCLETNTGITNVSDLMATDISKNECDKLYQTFELCRVKQMNMSKQFCNTKQTSDAVSMVHHLLDTFMASSHCIDYYKKSGSYHSDHIQILFTQLSILFVLFHFSTLIITN